MTPPLDDQFSLSLSRTAIERALATPRFEVLGRLGVDRDLIGTWDPRLPRRRRILVPVDVQALVTTTDEPVPVVPLTGRQLDPPPFATPDSLKPGVHLHWAMPDSLLAGGHDEDTRTLTMRHTLPDTWVVVRTLQPVGRRTVQATGWVIDARSAVVVPLAGYTGTFPAQSDSEVPTFDPLTGASDSTTWTASYAASAGRFGLYDDLGDLDELAAEAPDGWEDDQAVYTVAGWWRDQAQDPLAGARGPDQLDRVLATLGWTVDHDGDETAMLGPDPRVSRLREGLGLDAPDDEPPTTVVGGDGRKLSGAWDATSFSVAYPVDKVGSVVVADALPRYDSLLHGSVLGVPVRGPLPGADDRPAPDSLSVALGSDLDDVVAAFGAAALHEGDADRRGAVEDVVAAFSAGMVSRLGSTDGLDDLGEREHTSGFWALPGGPVAGARPDRLRAEDTLAAGPMTVGRKGRAAVNPSGSAARAAADREGTSRPTKEPRVTSDAFGVGEARLRWRQTFDLDDITSSVDAAGGKRPAGRPRGAQQEPPPRPAPATPQVREVERPVPRYHRPAPFVLAVRGAGASHRHHGDGLFDDNGRLGCRYPGAAVPGHDGIVDGATVLPTLGSGAVPDEVLTVVREAVLLNPYGHRWLVAAGAPEPELEGPMLRRLTAEMVRLHGTDGSYDGTAHVSFPRPKAASAWSDHGVAARAAKQQVAAEMARFSLVRGTPPSPVAHTTWRQPWVPLWVEWKVTLEGSTGLDGWTLDGFDLEPADAAGPGATPFATTVTGRSLLGPGLADSLTAAVAAWVGSELQRQATRGRDAFGDAAVLQRLGDLRAPLDLVSASLDGIREQLLGIDFTGVVERSTGGKPTASGEPTVLFGGTLRLDELRLVDAFGRTLDATTAVLEALESTVELEVAGAPRTIRVRPRIQGSARWLWRLVDAAPPSGTAPELLGEAFVDQLDPAAATNPVAGFLLPDHIDETLEVFTTTGDALGEVGHDPVTGAVMWEPAPGRPVPPDAGPLVDVPAQSRVVAEVAAALVRADAAARAAAAPSTDTALTALLKAVDTTLWTVDTYGALGSGTVAGLVGRPIAVVRTTLCLDVPDDVAELEVTAPGGEQARRAAYDALADQLVEVHLGSLARSDDALLGYFVGDDLEHLHLVDKVLQEHARDSGRHVSQLGVLGTADQQAVPGETTLDHPYLVTDGRLLVRPRRAVVLTLLMLPAGRAHLTSGVLPRKDLALADSWVAPGLTKVMPSVRVGPVLVDPAEIRLPLVSLLGDKQTFTRRTGELTWRDDPILAATQTAYLPRLPHEAQEGWIRVTPPEPDAGAGPGAPGGTS